MRLKQIRFVALIISLVVLIVIWITVPPAPTATHSVIPDIPTSQQQPESSSTMFVTPSTSGTTSIFLVSLPTSTIPAMSPTTPLTAPTGLTVMAWLYPSEPGCSASSEYRDGRTIDIIKPEFFTVNGGQLLLITAENSACNGYSKQFANNLKQHSTQQFVTVSSASAADMSIFLTAAIDPASTDITTLVDFTVANGFTGIELDFEDFGGWSAASYTDYKIFVNQLGTALHAQNKKLMIDGPAIADPIEQNWFSWRYEDFASLAVDHMVVMAYDYQFDHGVGEPIAPLEWITNVTKWAADRYPKSKLSIGIPSYGYEGSAGKRIVIRTYDQLKNKPGFDLAARDPRSGELTWSNNGTIYFYQDKESLRQKISVVQAAGIDSVSIWHLGGNPWFE